MRPEDFQAPIVRFSEYTPSQRLYAADSRSRRLKVSAIAAARGPHGSGIDYQKQRASRRVIAWCATAASGARRV
jgi:hypothetical protein